MSDAAITMDLQSNIACSTQEAVNLVRHLGFGQRQSLMLAERQILNKPRSIDSLNSGALFCWCDPD